MMHVPICQVCGEWEVGTFTGSVEYCSEKCETEAHNFLEMVHVDAHKDEEHYMNEYFQQANGGTLGA
jgi:hypothetical protein